MYNYNHLYYFYITAQFGSITKASDYLNISQPSLSSQVKILEESFGISLFIRNGRNIELTTKGKIVYEYCAKMFKDVESLTTFLNSKEGENQKVLRVAVSDQVERPFVAEIIGKLIKKYKTEIIPKIIMLTDTHEKLIDQFKLGNIDLLVTHQKNSLAFSSEISVDFPVAIIGLPKYIYKDGRNFKNVSSLLKNYQSGFVMPTDKFKLRSETNIFLSKEKYTPQIFFESDILAANVRALEEGVGIGFLPIAYVKKEIKKGILSSFAPTLGLWKHQLYIVTNPMIEKTRAVEEFKKLFVEEANIN
jgi:LysR family transcriptional activator of nhaA